MSEIFNSVTQKKKNPKKNTCMYIVISKKNPKYSYFVIESKPKDIVTFHNLNSDKQVFRLFKQFV